MEFFHISYHQYEKKMIIVDVKLGEFLQFKSILYLLSLSHSFTGNSFSCQNRIVVLGNSWGSFLFLPVNDHVCSDLKGLISPKMFLIGFNYKQDKYDLSTGYFNQILTVKNYTLNFL